MTPLITLLDSKGNTIQTKKVKIIDEEFDDFSGEYSTYGLRITTVGSGVDISVADVLGALIGNLVAKKISGLFSGSKIAVNTANEFTRNISFNKHGALTDGVYTVSIEGMKKHVFGGVSGRSVFYPTFDPNRAVLKAAQYADKNNLWKGNKAKILIENINIGTLGNGNPTNYMNVYRNSKGFIHGSPGN